MIALLREPWRNRLLFLSVAGNLFSVALIGTHWATRRPHGPPGLEGAVERMARDLPPVDSTQFRAVLARERPWYDQARRRMDAARADLSRGIAQDPYDEALVRVRMLELQKSWFETSGRFGQSLVLAIGTLSPEGRQRLAHATAHPGRR